MLTTGFTSLVGCAIPIQQAGMGDVTPPDLVAAVSGAGALGMIGVSRGARPLDAVAADLDDLAARTAGVFGANLLPAAAADRELVELAASKSRIVDFYEAPSPDLVALVHARGALACWQVGSLREALEAVDAGCDVVVAQGIEAGGHVRGGIGVLPLLCEVLDEVDVPVLAAGGVGTARALAAVLAMGAAGARVGTRFVAATESGAHPRYIEALIRAGAEDTVQTRDFSVACPLCPASDSHRVLRPCLDAAHHLHGELAGELERAEATVAIPRFGGYAPSRDTAGHVEAMALYAGQSVGGVRSVMPAADIVRELADGAERLLSRWATVAAGDRGR